jgi:hypothetical protein
MDFVWLFVWKIVWMLLWMFDPPGLLCGVNLYWKTAILNFNLKAYRGLAVPIMLDLEVSFMGGFNLCRFIL